MDLTDVAAKVVNKPLAFVKVSFPWGKGVLRDADGPDEWQSKVLRALGEGSVSPTEALRIAVASGHGIGKTALIAWIILWYMCTRPHPQVVVTANTQPQLKTKTWRELAKWWKLSAFASWFKWTATSFYHVDHKETWFASAVPWSLENSEAFAGTHEKYVLMIYDEASKIDDAIWEVTEGAMTTPGAVWIAFGNPTRNVGRFKECFPGGRHARRWLSMQIDSRTAKMANKREIDQWIQDYGEDSDFVRVRVKGEFPRASSLQFIAEDIVVAAMGRYVHPDQYYHMPKIIGVDVARYGDDQSVIMKRQGIAAFKAEKYRELDNMTLAGICQRHITDWRPDMMFIDEGGGQGVIDRLRQLGHDNVMGVQFGGKAIDKYQYANKRAEMWGLMKEWLAAGGSIPEDRGLKADLIGPEYGFTALDAIQLERKEDMKKRGLSSPDAGDALALTFAMKVLPRSKKEIIREELDLEEPEYNPLMDGIERNTRDGWNPLLFGLEKRR